MSVPKEVSLLLLLLSREKVPEESFELVRDTCSRIEDWGEFTSLAARKFSLPMVYQNLLLAAPRIVPISALEDMQKEALVFAMVAMKVSAAQIKFFKLCIEPLCCDYVFLKGAGLAHFFYNNAWLRCSRDVDVLVSKDSYEAVVRRAISQGYKIKISDSAVTLEPEERDLRTLLRIDPVITLFSPNNDVIEVHREVDKELGLFSPRELISGATEVAIGDATIRVPSTAYIFNFVSYHSARHTWSRLNWLADIDAILEHPLFDLEEALTLGDRLGLLPTLRATLEFNEITKSGSWSEPDSKVERNGAALLDLCLANLEGDLDLELKLRSRLNYLELPHYWLLSPRVRLQALLRRTWLRLRPSYYQYEAWPLPENYQWLYYPTKPFFSIFRLSTFGQNYGKK